MPKEMRVKVMVEAILPPEFKKYSCQHCKSEYIISSKEKVIYCPICSERWWIQRIMWSNSDKELVDGQK